MTRLLTCLALLTLPGVAEADFVTYNRGFAETPSALFFPRFDPSLGTLTGIRWTLGISVRGVTVWYDNERPEAVTGLFDIGAVAQLLAPGLLGLEAQAGGAASRRLAADDDGFPPDFAGPDSVRFTDSTPVSGLGVSQQIASTLFPFYTGTNDLQVSVGHRVADGRPSNVSINVIDRGTVSGTASLRYEFTPIPEPSTFALASGVLLISTISWRLQRYRRQRAHWGVGTDY